MKNTPQRTQVFGAQRTAMALLQDSANILRQTVHSFLSRQLSNWKTITNRDILCQDCLLPLQVVLPEGATSISAKVPFPVNQSREVKHTYLDTTGRPVVVLHKTNLVPDHNVEFTVNYSFFSLLMLREPFLLVSVFALLFAGIIGYVRCDFVLSRDNKWHADRQKEKAVALVQKFTGIIAGDQPLPTLQSSACQSAVSLKKMHLLFSVKVSYTVVIMLHLYGVKPLACAL